MNRAVNRTVVKQRIAKPVVFTSMTALPISSGKARSHRGVAVERPRASDAIGTALRNAFDREAGLPSDMMRLLRCLDSAGDRTGARPRSR